MFVFDRYWFGIMIVTDEKIIKNSINFCAKKPDLKGFLPLVFEVRQSLDLAWFSGVAWEREALLQTKIPGEDLNPRVFDGKNDGLLKTN